MASYKYCQSFNNRMDAWVKFRKTKSGKLVIVNVKQRNPHQKFKGVPVKK
jgi:hypothetical protein